MPSTALSAPAFSDSARFLGAPILWDATALTVTQAEQQALHNRAFCFYNLRRLHELESRLFPDAPRLAQADFNPLSRRAVEQQIDLFLSRVNQELFPVVEDCGWNDWDMYPVACLTYIYHVPQGVSYDEYAYGDDSAFDERGITDILMCLAHPELYGNENVQPPYALLQKHYPGLRLPPTAFTIVGLDDVLAETTLRHPLDALPDLLRIVTASTDLIWLDYGYEEYLESFEPEFWDNQTTVNILTEEWALALPIVERVAELTTWADVEGQENRWQLVLDTLYRAHIVRSGQPELPLQYS